MQRVYEPQDLLEAELLRAVLGSEGIVAHLAGRDLLGAVGELPLSGLLALLVEDAQAERARVLIGDYLSADPLAGDAWQSLASLEGPDVLLC